MGEISEKNGWEELKKPGPKNVPEKQLDGRGGQRGAKSSLSCPKGGGLPI